MQITATGALMRLAETVYSERYFDDQAEPPPRELADAALVLASAGSERWARIAARVIEAWPPADQFDYLQSRDAAIPPTVRAQFQDTRGWPEPVADGEQMVELVEIEGGAIVNGDGSLDLVLDGTIAPSADEIVARRFNQIEKRLDESDERMSHFESALDAHEAGLQIVAASLSRHIVRAGALPRWRSLEEFEALVAEVLATERVPLDRLTLEPPAQEG